MKKVWIITKHELRIFFDSLMAYVMLVLFLGFSGFFTWLYGSDIFFVGQASLQAFFGIAYWTLFFFIPALTMRLVAEERRSGTIELLLTKPVTDWQVILGKFFSTLILIIIALALTLPYYITISKLASVDHGAIISGYIGLIFMSAVYISIGIFTSSLSNNQIVGFLLSLFIGIFFHIIFDVLSVSLTGITGSVINFLSMTNHFDSISRGVIDSKDLIYFLSLITLGLISSEAILAKRNV
jgi:ABC-2 type transport system permease protein